MKNSKNIYDLLNNIDFDIEDYEEEELNDLEKKKIKNNFKKKIKNNFSFKKLGSIAAALLLTVGILSQTNFGINVYAMAESKISEISYSIGKALHIERDIEHYSNIINQTIEKNGIEIKLKEVILDKDELIFSTIVNTNIPSDAVGFDDYDIFVNGKKLIINSRGGSSTNIDDSRTMFIESYSVGVENINIIEDVDIKIILKDFSYLLIDNTNIRREIVKGKWEFEFSANGKELMTETYSLPINHLFNIGNQKYKLDEFRYNPVNQEIYGTVEKNDKDFYGINLVGYDDLGNEVIFEMDREDKGEVYFKYFNFNGDLSDDASSITLVPYAAKVTEKGVSMRRDSKPVGEEFTIYLKNNK